MRAASSVVETWSLYAFGSLIIFMRAFCRWRTVGLRGFQADDYIILISWGVYTIMTVAAHMVGLLGDIHSLTMDERRLLTDTEARIYARGTQWFCVGVVTYNLFIWSLKLTVLFLYRRVVRNLWVEKLISPMIGFVAVTFIAINLILFCACRPYSRIWIVYPDQGPLCKPQSILNMVPPLVMNVITDLSIMMIPAPVLVPLKIGLWKRIGLLFLFGSGLFVMIAAILRVTMVLMENSGATAAIWSCREDFVAIVITQAIAIRPMFRSTFWRNGFVKTTPNLSAKNISFQWGSEREIKMSKTAGQWHAASESKVLQQTGVPGQVTNERFRLDYCQHAVEHDKIPASNGNKMVIHVDSEIRVDSIRLADQNPQVKDWPNQGFQSTYVFDCWHTTQR